MFADITQLHMITCFNFSASVFLLWEFCLFQSYSPWYRKAVKLPLKPTYLFSQSTHVIQYIWKGRCPKCGFLPCSHSQSMFSGSQILGPCSTLSVGCFGHDWALEYDLWADKFCEITGASMCTHSWKTLLPLFGEPL